MTYSIDPHADPSGMTCPNSFSALDPETSAPICACGTPITAEGGLDPRRLVPHSLSPRTHLALFAEPVAAPHHHDIVATGSLVDQWGHSALVLTWQSTPMLIGPSHSEAMRTIGQLTRIAPELRDWLVAMWSAQCSERARLEEQAHQRRRAARMSRSAAGRTLLSA